MAGLSPALARELVISLFVPVAMPDGILFWLITWSGAWSGAGNDWNGSGNGWSCLFAPPEQRFQKSDELVRHIWIVCEVILSNFLVLARV